MPRFGPTKIFAKNQASSLLRIYNFLSPSQCSEKYIMYFPSV